MLLGDGERIWHCRLWRATSGWPALNHLVLLCANQPMCVVQVNASYGSTGTAIFYVKGDRDWNLHLPFSTMCRSLRLIPPVGMTESQLTQQDEITFYARRGDTIPQMRLEVIDKDGHIDNTFEAGVMVSWTGCGAACHVQHGVATLPELQVTNNLQSKQKVKVDCLEVSFWVVQLPGDPYKLELSDKSSKELQVKHLLWE